MQSSPVFCNFFPLRSKYSLRHLFSDTLNLCYPIVSQPYKTTGKNIVQNILKFNVLETIRKTDSELNVRKLSPILIFSGYLKE
jgi:hypothetical protein